jgi:hypothetical protein
VLTSKQLMQHKRLVLKVVCKHCAGRATRLVSCCALGAIWKFVPLLHMPTGAAAASYVPLLYLLHPCNCHQVRLQGKVLSGGKHMCSCIKLACCILLHFA